MSDPQLEIKEIERINAPAGETVFAIVRSKPPGNANCEAGYIQVSIGRRLWAGLYVFVCGLFLAIVLSTTCAIPIRVAVQLALHV